MSHQSLKKFKFSTCNDWYFFPVPTQGRQPTDDFLALMADTFTYCTRASISRSWIVSAPLIFKQNISFHTFLCGNRDTKQTFFG